MQRDDEIRISSLNGVNYDKKTKKHQCLIESYGKQER